MPSDSQEKRPTEVIRLGCDFRQSLLLGESVQPGNIAVTVKNLLTDANATSTILVAGSPAVSVSVMTARFQAGAAGDLYEVLFSTGLTNFLNAYQGSVNLVVTDQPGGDFLLATLDQVKRALNIPLTDLSDDTALMEMLASATAYVQARTARFLFLKTFTEDIPLDEFEDDLTTVQLWEYPVVKIDAVTFANRSFTDAVTITDPLLWTFTEDGLLTLHIENRFVREPGLNRVVYRAGYAKIPDDLSQACAGVASTLYRNIGRDGLTREQIGDYGWQRGGTQQLPSGLMQELSDPMLEGAILHHARPGILR